MKYTLNVSQSDIGLEIVEKNKTTKSEGIVYEYEYTWDTQKSKIKKRGWIIL